MGIREYHSQFTLIKNKLHPFVDGLFTFDVVHTINGKTKQEWGDAWDCVNRQAHEDDRAFYTPTLFRGMVHIDDYISFLKRDAKNQEQFLSWIPKDFLEYYNENKNKWA